MIRDCGSVVFATTFGNCFTGDIGRAADAAVSAAAVSASRTTRRARETRELSSKKTGGTHRFLPRTDQFSVSVKLGLMRRDLASQMRACFSKPVWSLRDPPDDRLPVFRAAAPR